MPHCCFIKSYLIGGYDCCHKSCFLFVRVFQSLHTRESKFDSTISISTPPIVDVTFKQTQTGDRCVDILIEKTRLNLSVSFVTAIIKFAMDSVPIKSNEGGFINHGYVGDVGQQVRINQRNQIYFLYISYTIP